MNRKRSAFRRLKRHALPRDRWSLASHFLAWRTARSRPVLAVKHLPPGMSILHAAIFCVYVYLTGITPEYGAPAVLAVWAASWATLVWAWSIVVIGERILA